MGDTLLVLNHPRVRGGQAEGARQCIRGTRWVRMGPAQGATGITVSIYRTIHYVVHSLITTLDMNYLTLFGGEGSCSV